MPRSAILVSMALVVSGCATVKEDPGRPLTDAESQTTAMSSTSTPTGFEVCELVGRDSIVRVLSTDAGTRYTLCTLEGAPIAENLDASGLARLRPDLDPKSMQADEGHDWGRGALMMVDSKE